MEEKNFEKAIAVSVEQKSNIIIDWLTISIPIDYYPVNNDTGEVERRDADYIINDLLSLLDVTPEEYYTEDFGLNGYQQMLVVAEDIKILYKCRLTSRDSTGRDSVSLLLSGQGCRRWESRSHSGSLFELVVYLNAKYFVKCTRLDFSLDSFNLKHFTLDQLFKKIQKFCYTSQAKSHSFNDKDGRLVSSRTGESCYIGTPKSDRYLLIYDKLEERKAKGFEVQDFVDTWYRFELVFSGGMAQDIFSKIALMYLMDSDCIPSLYLGALNDFICIKKESTLGCKNAYKMETWEPWKKFINDVPSIKITNQFKIESNIKSKVKWHRNSVSRSDFLFYVNFGPSEFLSMIMRDMAEYALKAGNKELAEINTYRHDNKMPLMSKDRFKEYIELLKKEWGIDDE